MTFQKEYKFTNVKEFLTSVKVLTIFPRKFHHCFWRSKHDVIYHRQRIAWRRNTFFSVLNIPLESEQKQTFQITKSSVSHAKQKYSLTLDNFSLSSWSQIRFFIHANVLTPICEGLRPKFDQIDIFPSGAIFFIVVNLLT